MKTSSGANVKEQVIHLEPHDDVTSVRDKLGWIRAPRVLLNFPDDPRYPILRRKLDLVLIQREATRRQAQLALVTRDPEVIEQAEELGIACFRSIEASHQQHWHTRMAQLTVDRGEYAARLDPDLVEIGTRLKPDRLLLSPGLQRAASVALFVLLGVGLLGGGYLVLPGAIIYLAPASNQVTVTTTITADPQAGEVQPDRNVIPARIVGVEVESAATVETTGTAELPTEKARGIVLFTNLIPDQVTIPAGSIVRTSAAQPVRFVTLADATLPGRIGETVEVPIEALEAGFVGNLPPGRINQLEGPLGTRVAVANAQPTRGGDVQQVPAIAQADYDRVRALVLQQLQQRAFAEMQTNPYINLQAGEFIPLESLVVVLVHAETYQGYVGQPADQVSLTMRVTVQGTAIDERFARQIVYARLAEKVGPGYQIGAESLIFRRGEVTGIDDERRITFIMQGAGDVTVAIETQAVRQMTAGKPISQALDQLNQELPLAAPPVIEVWPGFWPVMPSVPFRIQVEVSGQP